MDGLELFESMSYYSYRQRYKSEIRSITDWKNLDMINPENETIIFTCHDKQIFYHPWRDGTLFSGDFKYTDISGNTLNACLRAPGVYSQDENRYFLLDGNHRFSYAKPMILVLDSIIANTDELRRCFADLLK